MKKSNETLKIVVNEIEICDVVRTSPTAVNDETDKVDDGYSEKWWEV